MKNALISPSESPVKFISGWTTDTPPEPIWTNIEYSCRVAEVSDSAFEVAQPLFWIECDDNIVADRFYYNTQDNNIYPTPNDVEMPE